MMIGCVARRDGHAVRASRLGSLILVCRHRLGHWLFAVERRELGEVHALDVASDASFGKAQRHPRLEFLDDPRLHFGMLVKVIVQTVGERIHQRLQPRRTLGVLLLQRHGIDEQFHPQVLINLGLAFRLCQSPHRVDVICFDAIEVVLGLGIFHAKDGIGVCFPVDVRDAPIIPDDGDVLGLALPARDVRVCGRLGSKRDACNSKNKNEFLHKCHLWLCVRH